jgi:hypothetical protein
MRNILIIRLFSRGITPRWLRICREVFEDSYERKMMDD